MHNQAEKDNNNNNNNNYKEEKIQNDEVVGEKEQLLLEKMRKSSTLQQRQSSANLEYFRSKLPTIRFLFVFHFIIALAVVSMGAAKNGGRKYIPLDVSHLPKECKKGYVNVFANSRDEPGAIVCCDGTHDEWSWLNGSYEGGLCVAQPTFLPYSKVITRFPESWLLPLVPLLFRFAVAYISKRSNIAVPESNTIQHTRNRMLLYALVMCVRGFILYLLFNVIEDGIILVSQGIGDDDSSSDPCWYQKLLKSNYQAGTCHGRTFDYSDHVVLFLSHYLPCLVFETLYNVAYPFWRGLDDRGNPSYRPIYNQRVTLPRFFKIMFVYMNFLTFLAVFRTAAYFHTPAETAVGYLISLLVQIPMGLLIMTEKWSDIRGLIGLPTDGKYTD